VSDPLARLSAALGARYAIQREVGSGGMATVYLARDLKHDREVALKVLRPELAATAAGGDIQTMLLPLGGGQGRAILERNQVPVTWSPDGRQLLFTYTRNAPYDLGILTVADGSVRRITQTPESEGDAE
jgi:serine/threonine protein kinase